MVILAVLRHKVSGREIGVATTHLKARQGALLSTLRNEQGKDILDFLADQVTGREEDRQPTMPIILAGDFNAEPSEPVYSTLRSDARFGFESAYRNLDDGMEPPYTTWKVRGEGECCHTIDYVFYTRKNLNVRQVLPFPTGEQIGPDRVPSLEYPSDHFSLVVDFKLIDDPPPASVLTTSPSGAMLNKLMCV